MDSQLARVFEAFPDAQIAIIGSAADDLERARDIDVLFLSASAFQAAVTRLHGKYNGWDRYGRHIRRANVRLRGVDKPVQLTQDSAIEHFSDHPYAVLLRDGTMLHEGATYMKPWPKRRPVKEP